MQYLQTLRAFMGATLALSLAACAGNRPAPGPPPPLPRRDAAAVPPSASAPSSAPAAAQALPRVPPPPAPAAAGTAVTPPKGAADKPAPVTAKPLPPATAGKQPAKPKPVAATAATAAAAKPAAATLNLADLEQRLRDTAAIGVFTKLSLKNQVDDLLNDFRSLYKANRTQPPAELRERYDSLLAKVLGLLQSGDPQLAQSIASSREAIWGILSDPEKFSKI